MNSLYNSALKQSTALRGDLDTFAASPATAPAGLQGQISTTLTSLGRTLEAYADAARKELDAAKQTKAQERIAAFRAELRDFRQRFDALKRDREEHAAVHARSELLGRRPHHATSTPENPYAREPAAAGSPWGPPGGAPGGGGLAFGDGGAVPGREDHALREQGFFQQGNQQLDEYLERGREVLSNLGQQRDMLKNTQRKVYSVANTLGVSGDTIRMVERRAKEDKVIFWSGVVIFFGFCWLVLHYLR